MRKKLLTVVLIGALSTSFVACGNQAEKTTDSSVNVGSNKSNSTEQGSVLNLVSNSLAQDEDALIESVKSSFIECEYVDEETGLSVTYNLYVPSGYSEDKKYPMEVFIADSSCAGQDATASLTQGLGGVVWASGEWQSAYESFVLVPTYPETILDDHGSYTTTEYVELTKRLIENVCDNYSIDSSKIYGTGQSMGCMTTLILASEYPDLYAACMFVDGQWDVAQLAGLENVPFVYFAAEDDTNAYAGLQEVMSMFDKDGVSYSYAQWDGTWTPDELTAATGKLFTDDENHYFISWKTGTIDASTGNMPSMGGGQDMAGDRGPTEGAPQDGDFNGEKPAKNMMGEMPEGNEIPEGEVPGDMPEGKALEGNMAGMNSSSYHMASFDYAYNCIAVMEWVVSQ